MIITKEQLEYWVSEYEKTHSAIATLAFIDGINHAIDRISEMQKQEKTELSKLTKELYRHG